MLLEQNGLERGQTTGKIVGKKLLHVGTIQVACRAYCAVSYIRLTTRHTQASPKDCRAPATLIKEAYRPGGILEQNTALITIETLLRIGLGLRFLYSGISNVRRWPNPVRNAAIVFPAGTRFFGGVAVVLMVGGGLGLALGAATRAAAAMIALFLLPAIQIQFYWLRRLPGITEEVRGATAEAARPNFQLIARQAYHSHETAWQANVLFMLMALYFVARGSAAFGLDNLF